MSRKTVTLAALTIALASGAALAADPPLKDEEKWVAPTEAAEDAVTEILARYRDAVEAKNAEPLCKALTEMLPYTNEAFREPAEDALRYRLGTEDKKAVKEMARERGLTKAKYVQALYLERMENVQVLGAKLLANYPGKSTEKLLHRTFANKKNRQDLPRLTSEVIIAMGRIGYTKAWEDIEGEFKKFVNKDIMRAAVIYFGLTKEKRVAKMLCDHIDEPAPANVNSDTNPPASYWKARWETWDNIKDVVQWALKEITGYEGEFHTSKQARDYIDDHGRELGIR